MRSPLIVVLLALPGCSSLPGLDNPQISFEGQYALLELGGKTKMQPGTEFLGMRDFGLGGRDDDFGGTVTVGDGFSGVDAIYFKLDQKTSNVASLPADWGNLQSGDDVRAKVRMDEFRLRYIAQLFEHETDKGLKIQVGPGVVLAHRDLKFEMTGQDNPMTMTSTVRTQNISIGDDGVVYLAGRARVSHDVVGLQVDYAISPDLGFGGEFDGVLQDLEILGTLTIPDQDLTFYAGYRYSWLPAKGAENGLDYEADLTLDGFLLGLKFIF